MAPSAADTLAEWRYSIDETCARRFFQRLRQRPIFRAVGSANRSDPAQVILRLIAVALLDLPQAVILPGQHVVRVGLERTLIPGLRQLVVAELAVGVADQIGHVRMVVITERLQLIDGVGIFVAVIDRRIGGAIALRKSRIDDTGLLGLFLLLGRLAVV